MGSSANREKGFTLIELLVVISIVGLLSAIILASLGSARKSAVNARVYAEVRSIQLAMALYFSTSGFYPSTDACYDTSPAGDTFIPCCTGNSLCKYKGSNLSETLGINQFAPSQYDMVAAAVPPIGPYIKNLTTSVYQIGTESYQGYFFLCTIRNGSNCTNGLIFYLVHGDTDKCKQGDVYFKTDRVNTLCSETVPYTGIGPNGIIIPPPHGT